MGVTKLMDFLEFDDADLTTNRQGKMSSQQKERLRQRRLGASIIPGLFLFFFAALLQVTLQDFSRSNSPQDYIWRIASLILLIFIGAGFFLVRWQKISSDLRGGQVRSVDGQVSFDVMQTRNLGYYGVGCRMRIGNTSFIVPWDARYGFNQDETYRVYYGQSSKIILSAEILPNA